MRASFCRGCDYYDSQDKYCHNHEMYIKYIDDCDDYYDSDDMMEYMFGEDGPDDGQFNGD